MLYTCSFFSFHILKICLKIIIIFLNQRSKFDYDFNKGKKKKKTLFFYDKVRKKEARIQIDMGLKRTEQYMEKLKKENIKVSSE